MKDRVFPAFWKLNEEDQDKVLSKLRSALLWKGWDKTRDQHTGREPNHATLAVQDIARIFTDAGYEQEEYT